MGRTEKRTRCTRTQTRTRTRRLPFTTSSNTVVLTNHIAECRDRRRYSLSATTMSSRRSLSAAEPRAGELTALKRMHAETPSSSSQPAGATDENAQTSTQQQAAIRAKREAREGTATRQLLEPLTTDGSNRNEQDQDPDASASTVARSPEVDHDTADDPAEAADQVKTTMRMSGPSAGSVEGPKTSPPRTPKTPPLSRLSQSHTLQTQSNKPTRTSKKRRHSACVVRPRWPSLPAMLVSEMPRGGYIAVEAHSHPHSH